MVELERSTVTAIAVATVFVEAVAAASITGTERRCRCLS